MAILTIDLTDEELGKIREYAKTNGMSAAEYVRSTAIQHIEDEENEEAYEASIAQYLLNPALYSLDEAMS